MYHDFADREIEDLEMENMRRDANNTSPIVPSQRVKKYVQITEHNAVAKSFNVQTEYMSDGLPEWFKPLQPIVEDTTFSSLHITLGDVHYIITAIEE